MIHASQTNDAILSVGEVSGVEGIKVYVRMNRNKNASDLLFNGTILKNVSVGSYVEIRKGYVSIFGKIEGERLSEERNQKSHGISDIIQTNSNIRFLQLSLVGYTDFNNKFLGGIKELPLIGDKVYLLTSDKISLIHNLSRKSGANKIDISSTLAENIPISLPIDGIFNAHLAVFGNTGSGKSNTLAALFGGLFDAFSENEKFHQNCKFLFFDFNGEYKKADCLTKCKKVYSLSTRGDADKLPLNHKNFFDIETISVLFEATDKTQKPFIRRTLKLLDRVYSKDSPNDYFRAIVRGKAKDVLLMSHKDSAYKILEYLIEIFRSFLEEDKLAALRDDIEFHNNSGSFKLGDKTGNFFSLSSTSYQQTNIYRAVEDVTFEKFSALDSVGQFLVFLHIQLIDDLIKYRAQNDHVYPVVNRTLAKQSSISHTFTISDDLDFWDGKNVAVIDLSDVNIDMKKTIPLLLAKKLYQEHKSSFANKTLNIVIDEAHNILSRSSFRETEDWKDYRLETFEEIIKEGRKFGVFLTISSQRPSDISDTIISQAHNYFIHQLVNERDLLMIKNAISFLDKVSEESIPTLPVGVCIFSGTATAMPMKIRIHELPILKQPRSQTISFEQVTCNCA